MAPNDPMHAVAGPLEHREAAREVVGRNPLMFAPFMAGTPAWTAAKGLGIVEGRSPASVDEIFAGWEGSIQGLKDALRR